jgi:3-hydroxymyristoyl/3-hydroxydecanoyl-(acyl carrier protein) dehydratase
MNAHRFTIPPDHPALSGHFPGRPLIPGVVLLQESLATILDPDKQRVIRLEEAKFLAPVPPGVEVTVEITARTDETLSFIAKAGGRVAFRCRFRLGSAT